MLELTARAADAWVPSLAYAAPDTLAGLTRTLDAADHRAGRDPADIRRIYNITGSFGAGGPGYLQGSCNGCATSSSRSPRAGPARAGRAAISTA